MAIVLGRDVLIYSGSSGTTPAIAGARSCTIDEKCDMIEKASASNQSSKEFLAGRTEWEISMDHLITSGAPFEGLLKVGQTYTLRVVIGNTTKQGSAICDRAQLNGSTNALAKGTIHFTGTGPLT